MKPPAPEIIDMDVEKLEALLRRAEDASLSPEDLQTMRTICESYLYLTNLIDQKSTTIARLRKLLFGAQTEKTSSVLGRSSEGPLSSPQGGSDEETGESASGQPADEPVSREQAAAEQTSSPRKPGHGRNGADDYPGAQRVAVGHASLEPGDACPECPKGTLYHHPAGVLLRFAGRSPVQATVYELQKLRCHLCGKVYTAEPPADVGSEKYDATVVSMVGLLKYGTGVPFNRLDTLQESLQVPLPASTQWEIVSGAVEQFTPVHQELIRQAADGDVLYNDDTTVKILELMAANARAKSLAESSEAGSDSKGRPRTGLFTSGVVAARGGQRIALFFSGTPHAGENLQEVLRRRATDLPPPIQMCDALSRNMPQALHTIIANCLAHARRQFVDVHDRFPVACGYVLEAFQVVYRNDALAHEHGLDKDQRLALHQAESGPVMEQLHAWLKRQFDERLVEPNSALGKAIDYLRKHWAKLTLFLRVAGAPLDNNLCERALKKAILHRKNSLFYKTRNGAAVGDLYMSLIYTCQLCGANPFEYLTELQRHAVQVAAAPAAWLPWNYRASLPSLECVLPVRLRERAGAACYRSCLGIRRETAMRVAKSHDIHQFPVPLRRAAERFQRWRNMRRRGTPIPEPLWTLAAQLASQFGVCKTASALKLDYYNLKSRLAESASAGHGDPTAFLELPHSATAAGECIIDCQNSVGARMRIHLKGVAFSDLVALGRSLWSAE